MTDCPFCDYDGPSKVLREEGGIFVIEPLRPVTPGHVLVIPRRHVADFSEHIDITGQVFKAAARWCKEYCGCRECEKRPGDRGDVNLITSKGAAATQTVEHLHVHVVPRYPGDGLALPWSTSTQLSVSPDPEERDPRLGYDLALEAMRDGRRVRGKLSLGRGHTEGVVVSVEDQFCLLDTCCDGRLGRPLSRVYWAELDGFEILPGDTGEEPGWEGGEDRG